MFLILPVVATACTCFPRARGDVPQRPQSQSSTSWFSPRTRGCSDQLLPMIEHGRVFPAHAGMFRKKLWKQSGLPGFPRARGDVPPGVSPRSPIIWFSPRTRGCSCWDEHGAYDFDVFPAHAGMFPIPIVTERLFHGFPRARGDVPTCGTTHYRGCPFSPRTRGCSPLPLTDATTGSVFPAHAGMFRFSNGIFAHTISFPRARGDVPPGFSAACTACMFSPRTRGCSPLCVQE